MQLLPYFQTDNSTLQGMQTKWMSILNKVLKNPMSEPLLIKDIVLASGNNVINHKLGQTPQGYIIVNINAAVSIYRSQPFNDLTLTLNSSGAATISIAVF